MSTQVIKLGRRPRWRVREFVWAAFLLGLSAACLAVGRGRDWRWPVVVVVAGILAVAGVGQLVAAAAPRRVVLTPGELRLRDNLREVATVVIPRADVLGVEAVDGARYNLHLWVAPGTRVRVRGPFGWFHMRAPDDMRGRLVRGGGTIGVDARDAGAAYSMILLWIGDNAATYRGRRALLTRLANAMAVSGASRRWGGLGSPEVRREGRDSA